MIFKQMHHMFMGATPRKLITGFTDGMYHLVYE